MKRYDLTKKSDGWALTGQGAQRASVKADTKAQAIQKTQAFMENKVGSARIHKENGQIQEERTYQRADDPQSSKG